MANIEFNTFEAKPKANPYIDTVNALAEANDENAAVQITVDVNKAQYERNLFQRAANQINKTARLRHTDNGNVTVTGKDEDGNDVLEGEVVMTFTLTEKHKARRHKGNE